MDVLVYGFPKCVALADEMKQHIFLMKRSHSKRSIARRQGHKNEKELFSGHHHKFCYSTFVQNDVYEVIIRLDIHLSGSVHDRRRYNDSEPYHNPFLILAMINKSLPILDFKMMVSIPSFRSRGINATTLATEGACHVSSIVNVIAFIPGSMNRDIRKQSIRNEWSARIISNRF